MSVLQGIGGVFLYANDAAALAAWYADKLGLVLQNWGNTHGLEFPSADIEPDGRQASTVFAIFQAEAPLPAGIRTGRVNFRTHELDSLLARLRAEGMEIPQPDDSSYGRFAWIHDPEGNKVELWEPPRLEAPPQP